MIENNKMIIIDIITRELGKNIDIDRSDLYDLDLTGKEINLAPQELLYLFLRVEKKFNIKFQKKHVIKYNFNTINKICISLQELLEISLKA